MKTIREFRDLFKKNNASQKTNEAVVTSAESENNSVNTEKETTDIEKDNKQKSDSNKDKKNKIKAHIYNLIIVDESGSMSCLKESTLSGINETIATIHHAQKEFADTQEHTLTLVTFDSGSGRPDIRTMIDNLPITEVKQFTDYNPYGCTPLYDAMGQSLTRLNSRIKDEKGAVAVVTVLTDGLENSSTEWSAGKLRQLIEHLKSIGWSFAYMGSAHNVKEVTDLLSIENVVEFSHDCTGVSSTWKREQSSRHAYYSRVDELFNEELLTEETMTNGLNRCAGEYYQSRVSSDRISHLEANEVFVFGSDKNGRHGGGAAAFAVQKFGAVRGQNEGLQGQSYAIPTMTSIAEMREAILRFTDFAAKHPELRFLVTPIGCGTAGYSAKEIAPMFEECIQLENVYLPAKFWLALGLKMY